MLSHGDQHWLNLSGGYRIPYDPRPALQKLRANIDVAAAWEELWEELHHQGDVGDASYAAVPELVRIHRIRGGADWNTYALVGIIELARDKSTNPQVPQWLDEDYRCALNDLGKIALEEIGSASDPDTTRSMLGIIAISKGLRVAGRILLNYSEAELMDFERQLG